MAPVLLLFSVPLVLFFAPPLRDCTRWSGARWTHWTHWTHWSAIEGVPARLTTAEWRTKEEALDHSDDALTVKCLALAMLEHKAVLDGGADEVVRVLCIAGGCKRRHVSARAD